MFNSKDIPALLKRAESRMTPEQKSARVKAFWKRVNEREAEYRRQSKIHNDFDYNRRYTI